MLLKKTSVYSFRSISECENVEFEEKVTVLVGKNESGKTAFLKALHKSKSVEGSIKYNIVDDYPRKGMIKYQRVHDEAPENVCVLYYELSSSELKSINTELGFEAISKTEFSITTNYKNNSTVNFSANTKKFIENIASKAVFSSENKDIIKSATSATEMIEKLNAAPLNDAEKAEYEKIKIELTKDKASWSDIFSRYVYFKYVQPNIPKFLYFDEYHLLPGKVNIPLLKSKKDQAENYGTTLEEEYQVVLSLLEMAGIELEDLIENTGYEEFKARLEAISSEISDMIFKYWSQNKELRVEFDIRSDPKDDAPFNNGTNLYIRIENLKHRVTVPFGQRSRGFIWFFSFLVWFSSFREKNDGKLILLLDEPGLSLHALAQYDLLKYIDELAITNQIIYTTHSPFMVKNEELSSVRTVIDYDERGTIVSNNLDGSDKNTMFPLQAALGYTIAQNLFISKHNLLVEGPGDLIYLKYVSNLLSEKGMIGLDDRITIVPVGGLDNIATFVALLSGNQLEFTILHDYDGKSPQSIENLVKRKLIKNTRILNYAMFRSGKYSDDASLYQDTDVEDLFEKAFYLGLFNDTFEQQMNRSKIVEGDLNAKSTRVIVNITKALKDKGITLRVDGSYNHYSPSYFLLSNGKYKELINTPTLSLFQNMFIQINELLLKKTT